MSAPRRTTRRALAAALALLVLLVAVGCSDAPTEKEIAMADDGINPTIVSIFVPEVLLPVTQELGTAFATTHPGTTFQYTAKDSETLRARVEEGYDPAMWIDRDDVLAGRDGLTETGRFGENTMELLTLKTYVGPAPTLEDFGSSASAPIVTGLCETSAPCGLGAEEVLENAGVDPDPDREVETGRLLVAAVADESVGAALMYRSDASQLYTKFAFYRLPDPRVAQLTYQTKVYRDLPVIREFQSWIAGSPVAEAILIRRGYRPNPGFRYR